MRNPPATVVSLLSGRPVTSVLQVVAAWYGRGWGAILRFATVASGTWRDHRWLDYPIAVLVCGFCTAIVFPFSARFGLVNIAMLYLLGTTIGALRIGRGPSALLACTNILAFDYFFVPPVFSFDVADTEYLFALGVMLVVALVVANLMVSIRHHRDVADARERRTAVLYAMSRELAVASDAPAMAAAAVRHICTVFHGIAVVFMADDHGRLTAIPTAAPDETSALEGFDFQLAAEVVARGERCIKGCIYLPLRGSSHVNGVVVVRPRAPNDTLPAEQLNLLDAFAAQLALSLQRARVAEAAEAARISAERMLVRNTLLASISHDLRTPLSAIAGAGSLLAQPEYALSDDRRSTLGHLIERKALDMSQLLTNVLELMQMEFGNGTLRADWHAIDDLIALALRSNEGRLAQWRIELNLPAEPTSILVEATLIVQILSNLLQNAAKYTPAGTTITIGAAARDKSILLSVADDGPGFPPGDPELLFEKFQRGHSESNIVGVGLGLAICRAAARLHGGDIHAMNNPGGGARFEITLPVEVQADVPAAAERC